MRPSIAGPHCGDTVGKLGDPCKRAVELLGRLKGGIAAKRLGVADARLVGAGDAGERPPPGLDVVAVGKLGGVEARAQQEGGEVGDEIAHGADLAGKAMALAQEHGERMAAAIAESGKANGDHPARGRGRGQRRGVRRRLEHRVRLARLTAQCAGHKIKQRHTTPP